MFVRRFLYVIAFSALIAAASGASPVERTAFTPASPRNGTLFSHLAPESTGLVVSNAYDDPAMWGSRYRAYMGGAMGSGVAAGDFDQDGKVDLYVSTKTTPGHLFKNLGGWKFQDVSEQAGITGGKSVLGWLSDAVSSERPVIWRQGAVFTDVNNDGRPDLFVCQNNGPNLLYINRGDGTFSEEAKERGLAIIDGSVVGAFADYDRDGWLDVLILTNLMEGTEPSGRVDRLFHNDGRGYFTETTKPAGLGGKSFGHAANWFDYDDDGWPDLYICNDFSGSDYLYRNNHDGTFTNTLDAAVPHTPYSSMGADTGDINNDGHFDLFVADMATTTREKDRRGLAASRNDVLLTTTTEQTAPQYMRNALLLNTGHGSFGEVACWAGLEATDWTWSPRLEDFDNDGWTDLHVTNGMVREANNTDLLASMMRALSDSQRIATLKKAPPLNEANLAYRNLRGEGFEPVGDAWGLREVGVSFGSATADFDNDGDLDLAYLNYNGGLSVFRNDTTGANRVQVRLRGQRSNRLAIGAIVRLESDSGVQARALTAVRGYASGSELVAHFGLGSDRKINRLTIKWPSGITQVLADLDVNYAYLVTEAESSVAAKTSSPHPLFHTRSQETGLEVADASKLANPDKEQAFLPFRTDRRGPGIAIADVDGDGAEELFLTATTGSPARLLRRSGTTYIAESPRGLPPGQVEDGPALFLDADQNGTRDLLVTRASADATVWPDAFQPAIYSNDGRGSFTATDWLPKLSLNVGAACAADIDGDGDLDLFLGGRSVPGRYPETPQSMVLRNDSGRFVDISRDSLGLANVGLVKSALFRDVDQDGAPDLIVALEWNYIRYFHNAGNGAFSDWTEKSGFTSGGRGWWNSLASADFNGDGRPDFAAGNLGLNTIYKASTARPATLFYGDFAQNGTKMLAEAVYDGDQRYPLRPRGDLGTRLPMVLRRFPKNDDFARATMADVFGEKVLASADVHTADNFASGVFLSQPDGSYRFSAFPRIAQLGPTHGLVAADLDGDGTADVCAVQNSDAAVPRFHGGLGILLKGIGGGGFEALQSEQSGILIPGNARALVLFDADNSGHPSLFLTKHGDASDLLSHSKTDIRWIRIGLEGNKGNPDAIGARVQVTYAHRQPTHHEIGLGEGWLSQSAAAVFVAIPPGDAITEVKITWPDGHQSAHAHTTNAPWWRIRR